MLSVDYMEHEKDTMQFIEIDNKLHMDHILPKKYKNDADWNYISNHDTIEKKINSIGNMALLQWFKNEKAFINHSRGNLLDRCCICCKLSVSFLFTTMRNPLRAVCCTNTISPCGAWWAILPYNTKASKGVASGS